MISSLLDKTLGWFQQDPAREVFQATYGGLARSIDLLLKNRPELREEVEDMLSEINDIQDSKQDKVRGVGKFCLAVHLWQDLKAFVESEIESEIES
jgi:hypothetical protein